MDRVRTAAVGRAAAAFVQVKGEEAVARVDDDVDKTRLRSIPQYTST